MKNANLSTIIEDLKISFKFAAKNAISYLLALFGVIIVSVLLIAVVAAMIFVPMVFTIGMGNLTTFFESFALSDGTGFTSIALGGIMFALPFIAPFFVAIGALFGMGREIVESEGTSAEGVFTWYKKKFFSLAGGGMVLFLVVVGPLMLTLLVGTAIFGDQFLNIALISAGPTTFASPLAIAALMIWFAVSTGLLAMLFPSIIDGHSVFESTKRSIQMSIKYFDRVFGIWMAFLLIFGALIVPMILIPFVTMAGGPEMVIAIGLMAIYAIPVGIILTFLYLPAVTIGLTRTYMILTADDDYDETLEDGSSPSFIGGV